MVELIEANWIALVAALLLGLLVAWWVWGRKASAPRRAEFDDVLTKGAAPAQRNTALFDAAPAVPITPPPAAGTFGGVGEAIAAAAEQEVEQAQPAQTPTPTPTPAPATAAGDLTRIKGLGPKLNARLAELGVTTCAQVAAWSDADVQAIDAQLGSFAGRPARDSWVEQARLLVAGDAAGYEAKFGKL